MPFRIHFIMHMRNELVLYGIGSNGYTLLKEVRITPVARIFCHIDMLPRINSWDSLKRNYTSPIHKNTGIYIPWI